MIQRIVDRSLGDQKLCAEEIAALFDVPLFSPESAAIIAAGRRKSDLSSNDHAEVHAQVGLNVAPCAKNCMFCAFAAKNRIFRESSELTAEEAVAQCLRFEADGANAVFVMGTANYTFDKFVEMGQEIRRHLKPETIFVANAADMNGMDAKRLKEAGFDGVYHALRLGEGVDTTIPPENRLRTFAAIKEAGLHLGTCVEPVGPEHSIRELVEKTIVTRDAMPCYSGAARRISIPGTEWSKRGMVSEARMAHILAVVRLALPMTVPGNCTHEPSIIGAAAGANLFWAEAGSNPRDTVDKTEEVRGMTVADCRKLFEEAEWKVLDGPSRFYGRAF
jgi:biotin synthase